MFEERQNNLHHQQTIQKINSFKQLLHTQYGFIANNKLPAWQNARQIILKMPKNLFFNQPKNNSTFIFTTNPLPPGTQSLLNLGLKFCIKSKQPTNKLNETLNRFENNVRTKAWILEQNFNDNEHFNHKLYIKNPMWIPPTAKNNIENALAKFREKLSEQQHKFQQKRSRTNLTPLQKSALRTLQNNNKFIVVEADKNMGVTIWDRNKYIKQVIDEHLNNKQVYQNITGEIQSTIHDISQLFDHFLERFGDFLPKNIRTFIRRSKQIQGDRVALFRATAKVHKNPVQLRPIVAKCGTAIEAISKWLDCEFQKLIPEIPWCVRDSASFKTEISQLELPPTAKLVTFDAISMYSNIDLDHAMPIMRHWFESYVPPPGSQPLANINALMSALNLVMRWNICQFGDSYFKQLIGTAMGTSCAVFFANLYFGAHEKHKILPVFQDHLKKIFFYRRYVDDVFLIWTGTCDIIWDELTLAFNDFGILKWECT